MAHPAPKPIADRRAVVAAAATDVFRRYGYARTTMADIAAAAGVSRPALYLVFPGKDQAFAAVVAGLYADFEARAAAAARAVATPAGRLEVVCQAWAADGHAAVAAHPDAKDLFDLSRPPVRDMYARFQALVAGLIADLGSGGTAPATPADAARALVFGLRGLRETATSAADVRRLVAIQVAATVALLGSTRRPRSARV